MPTIYSVFVSLCVVGDILLQKHPVRSLTDTAHDTFAQTCKSRFFCTDKQINTRKKVNQVLKY